MRSTIIQLSSASELTTPTPNSEAGSGSVWAKLLHSFSSLLPPLRSLFSSAGLIDSREEGQKSRGEMITRSKLVEQLRDYQIRSQHKRDIVGALSWGLLLCFLVISSYVTLYFRYFRLSAVIICLGILVPVCLQICRQRKLAKKRERRLLLPLSM